MVYIFFFESDTIYISVKLVRIHEPWNFGYPKNREKIDWKQVENENEEKKLVQLSSNSCFSADCGFLLGIPENQISDTYSTTNLYTVPSSIKFGSLKKLDLITYYVYKIELYYRWCIDVWPRLTLPRFIWFQTIFSIENHARKFEIPSDCARRRACYRIRTSIIQGIITSSF